MEEVHTTYNNKMAQLVRLNSQHDGAVDEAERVRIVAEQNVIVAEIDAYLGSIHGKIRIIMARREAEQVEQVERVERAEQ